MPIVETAISYLSALLPLVTACIVTYVAWQQWQLNRHKIKMDLYEKRYDIYKITHVFLSSIAVNGSVKHSDALKFLSDARDAQFLFKPEMYEYINEIYKVAIEMESLNKRLEGVASGSRRSELVEKEGEKLKWLTDQLTLFTEKFSPYLKLD